MLLANVFYRYVSLCSEIFTGFIQDNKLLRGPAVDLIDQLLPALLQLHRDAVPNVRISLARCLAQHAVCLGMFSMLLHITYSVRHLGQHKFKTVDVSQ